MTMLDSLHCTRWCTYDSRPEKHRLCPVWQAIRYKTSCKE